MLTHLNEQNQPHMVNVGAKADTHRQAVACAEVWLPPALAQLLQAGEITTKKGPVFHTAILAGIMGAKRTSDLIPLCHPLPLSHCGVELVPQAPAADGSVVVEVYCRAETVGKTGVEMEALMGANVAALTLYDMGKALSHEIEIRRLRLIEKTGGKAAYRAAP